MGHWKSIKAGNTLDRVVEVPVPVYAQGFLIGVVGADVEVRHLVLLAGEEDIPENYFRCGSAHKKTGDLCRQTIGGKGPRDGETVRVQEIQRALPLWRGVLHKDELERIKDHETRHPDSALMLAYGHYVQDLSWQIKANCDFRLTFPDWVESQSADYCSKLGLIMETAQVSRSITKFIRDYLLLV